MKSDYLFFLASAFCIGIAYHFFNLSLIFLIIGYAFLFYGLNNSQQPLGAISLWATNAYIFMLYPFCQIIIDYAHGTFRIVLFALLIMYLVLITIFFLGFYTWLAKKTSCIFSTIILFPLLMTTYFFFIVNCAFALVGMPVNLAFLYPLLPALHLNALINYGISFNPWIAAYLFFVGAATLAQMLSDKKLKYVLGFIIIIGMLHLKMPRQTKPQWIDLIGIISMKELNKTTAWDQAESILNEIQKVRAHYPLKKLIIAPESTFCYPLNKYPVFVSLWNEYGLDDISLIIGAHRLDVGLFNTAYLIENGGIKMHYDKQKCLPISEQKVSSCLEKIGTFFYDSIPFNPSNNPQNIFPVQRELPSFKLLICSELLCTHAPHVEKNEIILCLANDSWFSKRHAQTLIFLMAVFRALQGRLEVLYVAHSQAAFITPQGTIHSINR